MNKKNLVLLHGALGSSAQFESWKEALEPHFNLTYFDFEGHGLLAPGGRPYRIEHFAENLEIVLHANDLPGSSIFGYSMGGYAALYLAATKPGLTGSIFTYGTKFDWSPQYAAKESIFLDPALMQEKVPSFAAILQQRHGEDWKEVVTKTAEMMAALGEQPLLNAETLPKIGIPVRLGVGDRDNTISLEEMQGVASQLSQGSVKLFSDSPHPMEKLRMEALLPELLEFFEGA